MNFIVREAQSQDYPEISKIMRETHDIYGNLNIPTHTGNPVLKHQTQNLVKIDETKIFVVENKMTNELLAYSHLKIIEPISHTSLEKDRYACINDFCVKSEQKKHGIGKLLFKQISEYAKSAGTTSLLLFEWIYNKDALEFYPSTSFDPNKSHIEILL